MTCYILDFLHVMDAKFIAKDMSFGIEELQQFLSAPFGVAGLLMESTVLLEPKRSTD